MLSPRGPSIRALWQRNYWEHAVRNGRGLKHIREYIDNNSTQWQLGGSSYIKHTKGLCRVIMKAGIVQFSIIPGDIDSNFKKVEKSICHLAESGADLVLLPEMWSCGFDYPRLLEHAGNTPAVIERLSRVAASCGVHIAGSLPEISEKGIKNTLSVLDKNGLLVGSYDKVHLFSPGDEHEHFVEGEKIAVLTMDICSFGLMICYDLRFPELSRAMALEGTAVFLVPAQWPLSRKNHWETLIRARAIENQVFVIAANCCGHDGKQAYAGHSAIISPWGDVLVQAGEEEVDLLAEIDLSRVEKVRAAVPCYLDRRPSVYEKGL